MYEWKRKKNRASKSQAENALDTADSKNTEKLKKHQTSDLRYLNGRMQFDNDGSQNNLIFKKIYNTFTKPSGDTETIVVWSPKDCQMEALSLLLHPVIVLLHD